MNARRSGAGPSLRPFAPGDERAIAGLFAVAFGRMLTEAEWRWRFRAGPAGPAWVELAWDADVLVGHYAASLIELLVRGTLVKTGLIVTAMVHPDYWGKRIFASMAERLCARAAEEGLALLWTFPPAGRHTHRLFVRDQGFVDIHEVPRFSLQLSDRRPETEDRRDDYIEELPEFDARFDRLWARAQGRYEVIVKRDCRYLDWRFTSKPGAQYRILGYADGAELLGYAVLKNYGRDLQIVDLLTVPEVGIGVALVTNAVHLARAEGLESVSMWLNPADRLHIELERLGFQPDAPVFYFDVRVIGDETANHPAYDYRNWHLTMSDSDVY